MKIFTFLEELGGDKYARIPRHPELTARGPVVTKHYHGDEADVKVLPGGILKALEDMPLDEYFFGGGRILSREQHPTLKLRL